MCSRFTFVENNISNLPNILRAKILVSGGLFSFISICRFGSFKNPLTITNLPEFYFRFRRFILLVQMKKKRFLWTMGATRAAKNHGDQWLLTWYIQWGINASILTWNHSQSSLAVAEALILRMEHLPQNISQMITKTIPISTWIVIRYTKRRGILLTYYEKIWLR